MSVFKDSDSAYIFLKCINLVTINAAFLVIGVVLYLSSTSLYGTVVGQETLEWALPPILSLLDIPINSSTGCPSGYESVLGNFPGTNTICKFNSEDYNVGQCSRKSNGHTIFGLAQTNFGVFQDNFICAKRANVSMNYHFMVSQRQQNCTKVSCGSSTDPNKLFCLSQGQQCPVNNFGFTAILNNTNSTGTRFASNWTITSNTTNSTQGPIVTMYIGLSRPCGITSQMLANRDNNIPLVYNIDGTQCTYNINGNQEHYLYQTTGLDELEYNVYNDNLILSSFKASVPSYKDSDLQLNPYRLYQKPYATWSTQCQQSYSTQTVANEGQLYANLSHNFYVLYVISISLYVVGLFYIAFLIFFKTCYQGCFVHATHLIGLVGETAMYIALIVLYSSAIYDFNQIDLNQLKYINDNQCSDGPLQDAFGMLSTTLPHDYRITGLGLAFVLLCLILNVVYVVSAKPVRIVLRELLCCSSSLRKKAYFSIRESVTNGQVGQFVARKIAGKAQSEAKFEFREDVTQTKLDPSFLPQVSAQDKSNEEAALVASRAESSSKV